MSKRELEGVPDEALAQRAACNDRLALQALLERHGPTAIRAAYAVLGRREEALDVAQDALLVVARSLSSCWRGGSFKAWVAVTARRFALTRVKGAAVLKSRQYRLAAILAQRQVPGPHVAVENAETLELLRDELAKLPPLTSEVITLFHVLDCSLAEVAMQTGLSIDACKARLYRGRQELGERLSRRGISLPCATLLLTLAESTEHFAAAIPPQEISQWAARAATCAARSEGKASTPPSDKCFDGVRSGMLALALLAAVGFGTGMDLGPPTRPQSGLAKNNETENLEMNFTQSLKTSLLAALAALSGLAAEPAPTIDPAVTWLKCQQQLQAGLSRSVRVSVEQLAAKLAQLKAEELEKIPGADLQAKAKYLLDDPCTPKEVRHSLDPFVWTTADAAPKDGTTVQATLRAYASNREMTIKNNAGETLIQVPVEDRAILQLGDLKKKKSSSAEAQGSEAVRTELELTTSGLDIALTEEAQKWLDGASAEKTLTAFVKEAVSFEPAPGAEPAQGQQDVAKDESWTDDQTYRLLRAMPLLPPSEPRLYEKPVRIEGDTYIFEDKAKPEQPQRSETPGSGEF